MGKNEVKRFAVIDLGTNTFKLLVVEAEGTKTSTLYQDRLPVKLGEGSLADNKIGIAAYKRGLQAMVEFKKQCDAFDVTLIKAMATSGLRSTSNNAEFVADVKAATDIQIEIISGDREAELIFKGVQQAVDFSKITAVIMDVGGGSTEFIIADSAGVRWKKSFPIGVTRIKENVLMQDPLTEKDVQNIGLYYQDCLNELQSELKKWHVNCLIGSSGSFESISAMLHYRKTPEEPYENKLCTPYPLDELTELLNELEASTVEERTHMKGLDPMRIPTIHIGAVEALDVLKLIPFKRAMGSKLSMKDGIIAELLKP